LQKVEVLDASDPAKVLVSYEGQELQTPLRVPNSARVANAVLESVVRACCWWTSRSLGRRQRLLWSRLRASLERTDGERSDLLRAAVHD
jgi:hypothetical protein